jgi:hypothetical protein
MGVPFPVEGPQLGDVYRLAPNSVLGPPLLGFVAMVHQVAKRLNVFLPEAASAPRSDAGTGDRIGRRSPQRGLLSKGLLVLDSRVPLAPGPP